MKIVNHITYSDLDAAAIKNGKNIFKSDTSYSFRTFDENGNTLEFHTYPIKQFDKLLTYDQQKWIEIFNKEGF